MSRPIKDLSITELEALMGESGLPAFRAGQILSWLYVKNVHRYDEMTNLPKSVREQLAEAFPLHVPRVTARRESVDGSRKYLLEFHDGVLVETVGLPSKDGRLTVCCSSQAGCAMGCAFCATGKAGFTRNLAPGEMIDQVNAVQEDFGARVTNIVVMGQGEPFANYDATLAALRVANSPKLLNIGARHITVSTCGLVKGIERFMKEPEQFTLAVSLHSARQEVRDELMPGVCGDRLGALRQALDAYAATTGRRFSLEYALMQGVNDAREDLDALVAYCRRLLCHVNLIPLNEVEGSAFKPSGAKKARQWRDELEQAGIAASIRLSRGSDIDGACGQLASRHGTAR